MTVRGPGAASLPEGHSPQTWAFAAKGPWYNHPRYERAGGVSYRDVLPHRFRYPAEVPVEEHGAEFGRPHTPSQEAPQ